MSAAEQARPGGLSASMRKTLLAAVSGAARTKARSDRMFENTMIAAVKHGIPQTVVAQAAGVSQAHVSRTLAAHRALLEDRKAARRSKRVKAGEPL